MQVTDVVQMSDLPRVGRAQRRNYSPQGRWGRTRFFLQKVFRSQLDQRVSICAARESSNPQKLSPK